MDLKRLSEDEAVELIISILKKAGQPLTTKEIEMETRKRMVSCPDRTPIFLNGLRLKGIVKGQLSPEKRAWIWWVEQEGESND